MTNLSIVSQDEVSENQVIRSRVAKTQQPDAERLMSCILGGIPKNLHFSRKRVPVLKYFFSL